jgi:hypothetical protein
MSEDIEARAAAMGWVPQETFRGNPDRWTSAEEYVERGETLLPIVKAQSRKLEHQVTALVAESQQLKAALAASQEAIEDLKEVGVEATKAAVKRARLDLMSELKSAKEDGDVERELRITDELTDLKAAEKAAPAPARIAPTPVAPPAPAQHPDFAEWAKANPWIYTDERKAQRALGIANQLRGDPQYDGIEGLPFYRLVEERLEGGTRPAASKVGGARQTSGSAAGTGGTGYASLPQEAKDTCERQAKKLVGEGKAFKTVEEWRAHYVNIYNA